MSQSCAVCKKIAVQSCSACNTTYYCSKEHQKSHWKVHKNACAPFKTTSDEFGKTLIAIRNIEPKEKIVIKLPLIIGPVSEKEIICISCYKKIDQKSNSICPKCGLKLCGKLCENREEHIELCKIFETQNINAEKCTNLFKFLIPLKILILKTTNFKKFDIIMSNYLYEEPRECFKNVLDELLTLCGKLGISTTNEELSKIYVMSKRNFLEINHTKSSLIKGLYPVIPLLKQNCVPNTKRIFSEDANKLTVLSTILIKKGETLTSNFAEPLWGTLDRQSYLRTTKFINCSCVRCKDPTELNIYTSSIYCQKCKDKLLEDKSPKIVSTNPLDLEASWKCEKCDNEILAKQIAFGNKSLAREINNINMEQPKCLEHFLFKYGEILHPTNSFSLRVKFKLVQIYGNTEEFKLNELAEELLERKIQLCHELLDIADILDPGFSRFRGVLLYELQAAMVMQARKEFCKDLITKEEAEEKLKKSFDILYESCEILLVEPEFKETLQEKLQTLNKLVEI